MPLPASLDETKLALGIQLATALSEGVIEATNINEFDNATDVYLFDLELDEVIDLRENSSYEFTADGGTAINERFAIGFKKPEIIENPTAISLTAVEGIRIVPMANGKALIEVSDAALSNNAQAIIYNIAGQAVNILPLNANRTIIDLDNNMSIVKVVAGDNTATAKIIK